MESRLYRLHVDILAWGIGWYAVMVTNYVARLDGSAEAGKPSIQWGGPRTHEPYVPTLAESLCRAHGQHGEGANLPPIHYVKAKVSQYVAGVEI